MDTYTYIQGTSPLLISMPHVGTFVPQKILNRFTTQARDLPDTDWHVDKLYQPIVPDNTSLLKSNISRYVIDLNRPPNGTTLYPGYSETELCPKKTFNGDAIYLQNKGLSDLEMNERKETYWHPYHNQLRQELDRIRDKYGYAFLWDAHSIACQVPLFFGGTLPNLNIGTANNKSCPEKVSQTLLKIAYQSSYSAVLNGRFKGGYITRHYGDPKQNIYALQLEISQSTYLNRATHYDIQEDKVRTLRPVLRNMLIKFRDSFE